MPEEIKLIQRVPVERDADGWWDHPDLPEFDEDHAAFSAWLVQQGLDLKQWHMEADIIDHHPYAMASAIASGGSLNARGQSGSCSGSSIRRTARASAGRAANLMKPGR